MNYQEFMETILENIKQYLPEEYNTAFVQVLPVVKNNDTVLDALMILKEDSDICPSIYLNNFYCKYENGMSMDAIFSKIAQAQLEAEMVQPGDVSIIYDLEQCQDRIFCKLFNKEFNEKYLEDKPFTPYEDFAVTYHVLVSEKDGEIGSAPITDRIMDALGLNVEKLHEMALGNMERMFPTVFRNLADILSDMLRRDAIACGISQEEADILLRDLLLNDDKNMYCVTNEHKMFGATTILRKENLDMIAEKLGGDYYVLPSSVHEIIVVPKRENMDYKELEMMVIDINQSQVLPEEVLSNHVYEYDAGERVLMRSDMAEQKRYAAKEAQKEAGAKKPLKEVLAEKKEDVLAKQGQLKNKSYAAEMSLA